MKISRHLWACGLAAALSCSQGPMAQAAGDISPAAPPAASAARPTSQPVIFNCDKSADKDVRDQLQDIEAPFLASLKNPKMLAAHPSGLNGDFCVATADLQDNGTQDIIAYKNFGSLSCDASSPVCGVDIYSPGSNGKWVDIFPAMVEQNSLSLLTQKVNGYHLLATKDYNSYASQVKDGLPPRSITIWYFDPGKFQYMPYRAGKRKAPSAQPAAH